mgnify:CR=1 FL=1
MEQRSFVCGGAGHPLSVVDLLPQIPDRRRLPVVMIHGGFHTGQAYLRTPDGRPGWAHHFAQQGYRVLVPDWPGHGGSPGLNDIARLRSLDVAHALASLVMSIGRCILLAHSAGGPLAWWLAESLPDQIAAVIGVAPGPPANMLAVLPETPPAGDAQAGCPVYAAQGSPARVDDDFIRAFWANSPRFPIAHLDQYAATIVPESPRILNERFNIGGAGLSLSHPERVAQRPILVVTGDLDLRHSRPVDEALAHFFQADFVWLPDKGIVGNGHMLMIEDNSHEIAELLVQWLETRGL